MLFFKSGQPCCNAVHVMCSIAVQASLRDGALAFSWQLQCSLSVLAYLGSCACFTHHKVCQTVQAVRLLSFSGLRFRVSQGAEGLA